MNNFFSSFALFLRVKWFFYRQAREVRRCFPGFIPYEKAFCHVYWFRNPFRICKRFLQQRGEQLVDAYGETPLLVFAQIARACELRSDDVVIDMGCGRGKGVFFLSHLLGCKVIGIEWIPLFVEIAQSIVNAVAPKLPVFFRCQEMCSVDFSGATVIYLYGTCLSDEEIISLVGRFELLASDVKIITVSFALSDYSSCFQSVKKFTACFPWGEGEVYLNCKSRVKEVLSFQLARGQR
jgi:SAM-dependent methyltransferase